MHWDFYPCDEIDDTVFQTWQAMNNAYSRGNPASDSRFIRLLLEHYGRGEELFVICRDGNVELAAAVVQRSALGQWMLFHPSQTCLSPLLHSPKLDLSEALAILVQSLPHCYLLNMPTLDPQYHAVDQLRKCDRFNSTLYGQTYLVNLTGGFDGYWSTRSRKLRQNVKSWLRRAEADGISVELICRRESNNIEDAVSIHAELESCGWKGRRGTAIGNDDQQGAFYRDLLMSFAETEEALTYQLYFDSQPVASLLGIIGSGITVILKTAHSEEHRRYAPGRLIDYLALQACFADDKLSAMDMYTRAQPADLAWATDIRELYVAEYYRSSAIETLASGFRMTRNTIRKFYPGTP